MSISIKRLEALINRCREIHNENPAIVTAADLKSFDKLGLDYVSLAPVLHKINERCEEYHVGQVCYYLP